MSNLLNLLGVSAYAQEIVKGAIIVGVIALRVQQVWRGRASGSWTAAKAP